MNDSRASSDEMPGFPLPSRSGRQPDEPLLDMILNGLPLPADAPRGMLTLADKLVSLAAPAGPGEVPGEAAAMAAFSRAASVASAVSATGAVAGASISPAGLDPARREPDRRPPPRRRAVRPARLASGLLVVIVGLGSAAAYADVLPGPVQDFAHHVIDAPPAHLSGEHQRAGQHAGRASSPGSARHPAHPAHPVKPGKASKRGKAVKAGKARGKAKHGFRPTPGKGNHHVKPTRPAHRPHPTPTNPVHSTQPQV